MLTPNVEIKKTLDGRLLARRLDGAPLTEADRYEAKIIAMSRDSQQSAWIEEEVRNKDGTLRAVKLFSTLIQTSLWVVIDRTFLCSDELACYYPEEIIVLRNKTREQLREIHRAKLVFPGCRIVQ